MTDPGTIYDVKTLNVFKKIGDAFLDVITRKTLFGEFLHDFAEHRMSVFRTSISTNWFANSKLESAKSRFDA